jgi:hypothetical protein
MSRPKRRKMAGAIYRAFLRRDVSRLYDPKFFQTAAAGTNFVAPGPKGRKEIDPAIRPGNCVYSRRAPKARHSWQAAEIFMISRKP